MEKTKSNSISPFMMCLVVATVVLLLVRIAFLCIKLLFINRRTWNWSLSLWRPRFPSLLFIKRRVSSLSNKLKFLLLHPYNNHTRIGSSLSESGNDALGLNDDDLKQLMAYIEETDGGPPWEFLMECSTPSLAYQAWQRDIQIGPTQYRTRTIFWNLSAELVRDFFWDDEFRLNWEDMLVSSRTLQLCPQTGTMIVHWIKKLPFFGIDQEYVTIRRIWECGSSYYCVTKGTGYPSLPRHKRPKRVDVYYSSWYIRPVEEGDGEVTGCEVLLFHQEEMSIPKRLVNAGVRSAMRSLVKSLDTGIQAYSEKRASGSPPSNYALMARLTTKVSPSMGQNEGKSANVVHSGSEGTGQRN